MLYLHYLSNSSILSMILMKLWVIEKMYSFSFIQQYDLPSIKLTFRYNFYKVNITQSSHLEQQLVSYALVPGGRMCAYMQIHTQSRSIFLARKMGIGIFIATATATNPPSTLEKIFFQTKGNHRPRFLEGQQTLRGLWSSAVSDSLIRSWMESSPEQQLYLIHDSFPDPLHYRHTDGNLSISQYTMSYH